MNKYGFLITIMALLLSSTSIKAQKTTTLDQIIEEASKTSNKYTPVEISTLPEAIGNAVSKDFPDAKIVATYKGEKDTYKLLLMVATEPKTVYASKTGEWFEPNK